MLKIITILNWIVVAIVGYLVIAETLFPTQGGDAAGRGMGKAIYYLAIIALIVLLILNLLPYALPKYIAFGLVAIPLLWIQLAPGVRSLKRSITDRINAKPFYEDPERERIARVLFDGKADKLKQLLQNPPPRLREPEYGNPLLMDAVEAALKFNNPEEPERLECIRILLAAGVSITNPDPEIRPVQIAAATSGNAEVLRILLEHGADPNAGNFDYSTGKPNAVPMIFETMVTSYGARDCVRLLLEFGADPNAIKPSDGDHKQPSALMMAAEYGRFDLCVQLIEKGANVHYAAPDGRSMRTIMAEKDLYVDEQYSSPEDLERVKKAVFN